MGRTWLTVQDQISICIWSKAEVEGSRPIRYIYGQRLRLKVRGLFDTYIWSKAEVEGSRPILQPSTH